MTLWDVSNFCHNFSEGDVYSIKHLLVIDLILKALIRKKSVKMVRFNTSFS